MKNTQPWVTRMFTDSYDAGRDLKPYEVGETTFSCVIDGCDWTTTLSIFAPPQDALAQIFGRGSMALTAEQQHHHNAERLLHDHYRTHEVPHWLGTIMELRKEVEDLRGRADA